MAREEPYRACPPYPSTWNIINLAYRIGLLSRAEWRRLSRAYDIRRDLEHEDADYEANVEDILYVFKVSIEAVLSKEPIDLLRVADVKSLVDAAQTVTPTAQFLTDYEAAPGPRQLEILRYLVCVALDSHNADIVRANAVEMVRAFEPGTKQQVKIDLAQEMQAQIDKKNRLARSSSSPRLRWQPEYSRTSGNVTLPRFSAGWRIVSTKRDTDGAISILMGSCSTTSKTSGRWSRARKTCGDESCCG